MFSSQTKAVTESLIRIHDVVVFVVSTGHEMSADTERLMKPQSG